MAGQLPRQVNPSRGCCFLSLPGTEVPLEVPWVRQSGWVACSPVEVGLLLELQGSGGLYWQVSLFRGSAGVSFVSVQFAGVTRRDC